MNANSARLKFAAVVANLMRVVDAYVRENWTRLNNNRRSSPRTLKTRIWRRLGKARTQTMIEVPQTLTGVAYAHVMNQARGFRGRLTLALLSMDFVAPLFVLMSSVVCAFLSGKRAALTRKMTEFLGARGDVRAFLRGNLDVDLVPLVRAVILEFVPEDVAAKTLNKISMLLSGRIDSMTANITRIIRERNKNVVGP
jgi:hypothetical protein